MPTNTINDAGLKYVYDKIDNKKEDKIDKTTTHVSGNPISISGLKSNQLAINPVITFEPIQAGSGTPSPVNERPISGYDKVEVLSCGKNIIIDSVPNATVNSSGVVATVSAAEHVSIAPVVKGQSYTFNKLDGATIAYGFFVNRPKLGSSSYNNSRTTASSGDSVVVVAPITGYIAINNADSLTNEQVELGSSPTTYEAPHKTTDLSESLGQTVYGGTLDVRTGKLTVTHKIVDLSTLAWTLYTDRYGCSGITGIKIPVSTSTVPNAYCSRYDVTAYDSLTSGKIVIGPGGGLVVFDSTSPTGQFVYELADSVKFTIQLTPHEISLLKDYAYVSTNGTRIAFDYHNGELASLGDVSQLGETLNISNMINANIYTEQEKAIGKWINGKTIYRKVLVFQNAITIGTTLTKVSEDKYIIILKCEGIHKSLGRHYPLYADPDTNTGLYVQTYINEAELGFVILEYVKK